MVFDLDGTLIDSEGYLFGLFRNCLPDRPRRECRNIYLTLLGRKTDVRDFEELARSSEEERRLREYWLSTTGSGLGRRYLPRPFARVALQALVQAEVPVAIATNSDLESASIKAECLLDLLPQSVICSAEEAGEYKPSSAVYRLACSKLGVRPEWSFAVEDSLPGAISASSAGLMCLVIRRSAYQSAVRAGLPRLVDCRLRDVARIATQDLCTADTTSGPANGEN